MSDLQIQQQIQLQIQLQIQKGIRDYEDILVQKIEAAFEKNMVNSILPSTRI